MCSEVGRACLCFVLVGGGSVLAQSVWEPLGRSIYDYVYMAELQTGQLNGVQHTALKPWDQKRVLEALGRLADSVSASSLVREVAGRYASQLFYFSGRWDTSARPLLNAFYTSRWYAYAYHNENFWLTANPVLELFAGAEAGRRVVFSNRRGAELFGAVDGKVSFYSLLVENQVRPPLWVERQVRDRWLYTYPANGPAKVFGGYFRDTALRAFDFWLARAWVSAPLTRHITATFGIDQHFVGDGVRSVLLGADAPPYLFFRLDTRMGAFHYQNLWAVFQHPGPVPRPLKYMAMHSLGVRIGKRLEFALFENVLFARQDTLGRQGGFDLHYLIPVIFYRSVEFYRGSPDNVGLGATLRYLPVRGVMVYGSLFVDEFYSVEVRQDLDLLLYRLGLRKQRRDTGYLSFTEKWAYQVGVLLACPAYPELTVRVELTGMRPYTYSHYHYLQNYTHMLIPMAHPLGANLREWLVRVSWQPTADVVVEWTGVRLVWGADTGDANWGGDILKNYWEYERRYGNRIGQGVRTLILHSVVRLSWQVKPTLWVEACWHWRQQSSSVAPVAVSSTWTAGLRWNIPPALTLF